MSGMCPEGRYPAKLVDYSVGVANTGTPQLVAQFEIEVGPSVYNLRAFHYFSDASKDKTIDTICGVYDLWCEPSEIEEKLSQIAAAGKDSGLLNTEKEYSVVVEHEVYEGKTRAKIKWVNNPGGGMKFEKLAKEEAKSLFGKLNLAGSVAKFKSENPGQKKPDGFKPPF